MGIILGPGSWASLWAARWLQQGCVTEGEQPWDTPHNAGRPPALHTHRAHCLWHHRVTHILNVAREIDNFFPALFTYMNVRVYDEEAAQLLPHWNDTFLFLSRVRSAWTGHAEAGTGCGEHAGAGLEGVGM